MQSVTDDGYVVDAYTGECLLRGRFYLTDDGQPLPVVDPLYRPPVKDTVDAPCTNPAFGHDSQDAIESYYMGTGPRLRIIVGPQDAIVKRTLPCGQSHQTNRGQRGKITEFSDQSKRRMVLAFRNCEGLQTLLTLTYPAEFPSNGELVKKHLHAFREWMRRNYPQVGGCWFLEFQRRGAPHFHAFLNGDMDKTRVAEAWYRIVGSGDEKHLLAGTRIERLRHQHAPGVYAAKYLEKQEQKQVPEGYENVGRFWGWLGKYRPSFDVLQVMQGCQFTLLRMIRQALDKVRHRQAPKDVGYKFFGGGRVVRRIVGFVQEPWVELLSFQDLLDTHTYDSDFMNEFLEYEDLDYVPTYG